MQEEEAQENEQKMESQRGNVTEAQTELKKHERLLMNINQQYKGVKNKMEHLSDEIEQLKVREFRHIYFNSEFFVSLSLHCLKNSQKLQHFGHL